MPFRFTDELSTADVAFESWGRTREELFVSSSAALLRTMTEAPERVLRRKHLTIRLEHEELDLLLWSFLQELIFFKDARRVLLHADRVRLEERQSLFRLEAALSGEKIDAGRHRLLVDVKAVTLHRFQVVYQDGLWKAFVVLDV
jgi:SHS2 domain-containing protein